MDKHAYMNVQLKYDIENSFKCFRTCQKNENYNRFDIYGSTFLKAQTWTKKNAPKF